MNWQRFGELLAQVNQQTLNVHPEETSDVYPGGTLDVHPEQTLNVHPSYTDTTTETTTKTTTKKKDSGANAPKEINPVFDAVALEIFGIKDASALNGSASSVGALAASVERLYTAQFGEYDMNKAAISVNRFASWCKSDSKFVPQYKSQFEPKHLAFLQNQVAVAARYAPRKAAEPETSATEEFTTPEQHAEREAILEQLAAKFYGGGK